MIVDYIRTLAFCLLESKCCPAEMVIRWAARRAVDFFNTWNRIRKPEINCSFLPPPIRSYTIAVSSGQASFGSADRFIPRVSSGCSVPLSINRVRSCHVRGAVILAKEEFSRVIVHRLATIESERRNAETSAAVFACALGNNKGVLDARQST